jgi:hypothetical protein
VPGGKAAVSCVQLPLSFEAKQGQTHKNGKFLSPRRGGGLFPTGDEVVLMEYDFGVWPGAGMPPWGELLPLRRLA